MSSKLIGKVALVTGAGRGIGKAIALALASNGAHVAVNFRSRQAEADEVRSQIEALGQRSITVGADVSLDAEVSSMVDVVQRQLGPIGVLVNNAGIAKPELVEHITEQSWEEVLACNLKSQFLLIQAVLPNMRIRQ
ncbi:MAG: SDR family NAD(P)-dependent oxidoreductase, partial [Desulfomonilaceae bacterium]